MYWTVSVTRERTDTMSASSVCASGVTVDAYNKRLDTGRNEFVDEVVVELQTLLVDGIVPPAIGDDPRPRDGEAICIRSDGLHDCSQYGWMTDREALTSDIFFEAQQMITCLANVTAILDVPRSIAELVPYLPVSTVKRRHSKKARLTESPLPLSFSLCRPPPSICAAAVAKPKRKSLWKDMVRVTALSEVQTASKNMEYEAKLDKYITARKGRSQVDVYHSRIGRRNISEGSNKPNGPMRSRLGTKGPVAVSQRVGWREPRTALACHEVRHGREQIQSQGDN